MAEQPDITVLAGYVRNKLRAGRTATVVLAKRRVHIIPHTTLGQDIPGLLVASDKGESLWVHPNTPLNAAMFSAGGFGLQRARLLTRVFNAIRGNLANVEKAQK